MNALWPDRSRERSCKSELGTPNSANVTDHKAINWNTSWYIYINVLFTRGVRRSNTINTLFAEDDTCSNTVAILLAEVGVSNYSNYCYLRCFINRNHPWQRVPKVHLPNSIQLLRQVSAIRIMQNIATRTILWPPHPLNVGWPPQVNCLEDNGNHANRQHLQRRALRPTKNDTSSSFRNSVLFRRGIS